MSVSLTCTLSAEEKETTSKPIQLIDVVTVTRTIAQASITQACYTNSQRPAMEATNWRRCQHNTVTREKQLGHTP